MRHFRCLKENILDRSYIKQFTLTISSNEEKLSYDFELNYRIQFNRHLNLSCCQYKNHLNIVHHRMNRSSFNMKEELVNAENIRTKSHINTQPVG